jgi:hypothetical protein
MEDKKHSAAKPQPKGRPQKAQKAQKEVTDLFVPFV